MRHAEQTIALALTFIWLGLVLGISGIETPLKFRAPGITLALGLGIGRLVFRALNATEIVIAGGLILVVARVARGWPLVLLCGIAALLCIQAFYLRPRLDARAERVIAGDAVPRSSLHVAYIALEGAKLALLAALGIWFTSRWIA